VKSHLTPQFRKLFEKLPEAIQNLARKNYLLWRKNPSHPSIEFKKVHTTLPIYSVRIGEDWRALGQRDGDAIVWFWIGSHSQYDKLLKRK
jgi:hypothetical protein